MLVFVLFYGLDWVATVPPTVALCREYFGAAGPVVFGWVFASHQIGAALAAGVVRDRLGYYDLAWYVAGALAIARRRCPCPCVLRLALLLMITATLPPWSGERFPRSWSRHIGGA